MVMICTFHSTDHAGFCLTGYTTRIQNHCKVSKVSPFFKCLIGKFICKKDSRSLGPYNTSCHFSLRSPYTPYQRKKMLENCCCCFLIYDKIFFKCLVYRPFSTKNNSRMTNFKATKIFILIDPLRMNKKKVNEKKKEGKEEILEHEMS